jgi:peptidoglycan hydrolase-like protein with peptidoglycan-binding domain
VGIEDHPDQSYEIALAPALNEAEEPLNTLRPALMAVACWRLDDQHFEFDSSFILPGAGNELRRLAELHADYAESPMSIFGHADPVGSEQHNKQLSGNRARALFALLTRDIDAWEELFHEHGWGLASTQQVLIELNQAQLEQNPAADSDPDDPLFLGPADGKDTAVWKQGVKRFQREQGLGVDGTAGKQTRHKLYELYMDRLAAKQDGTPFSVTADRFLGEGKDKKGKAAFQGCSEFNPIILLSEADNQQVDGGDDPHFTRNFLNAPNRRVVLYFFPPGLKIDVEKWPCPRASEGTSGCRKRFWSDHQTRLKPDKTLTRSYGPIPSRPDLVPKQDTFACRFYDRFARRSPCEAGFDEWIVQLVFPGSNLLDDRTRVAGVEFEAVTKAGRTTGRTDANGTLRVRARDKKDQVTLTLKVPIELSRSAAKHDRKQDETATAAGGDDDQARESAEAPGPSDVTLVTLTLVGDGLQELDDADAVVQAGTLDDRLFNLGFGAVPPPKGKRDQTAAIDDFVAAELDGVASPSAQQIRDKVRELYGS